jgi:iron complex outermembrane receptor protein
LGAHTLYTGIYATDTLDLTKRLSLTLGARYNIANISLTDELGNDSELNGNNNFFHFNPMIGATYKITPNLSLYGDYVVANRAPTPLELECSDPERPCLIDNALVGAPSSNISIMILGLPALLGRRRTTLSAASIKMKQRPFATRATLSALA